MLFDTNIAIHLRDRHRTIAERIAAIAAPKLLSLITLIELQGGVIGATPQAAARQQALTSLLAGFEVLPLDRVIVDRYASIITITGFSRPRILDRLIAATALVHDLTLVTINGADFRDVPGLRLEVWPAPGQ